MFDTLKELAKAVGPKLKETLVSQTKEMTASSVDELKEIDRILTEIGKTGELTAKQLQKLGDVSFAAASKYGAKAGDYLEEVKKMYDAGYKNAKEMAELSLLAQNTGGLEGTLAQDYIEVSDAAYRYFGNVEKLTALLDAQKQVTEQNAVSMAELLNATKASASRLSGIGIGEDEMTALFGTGIAATKESGETVGHAVNGILMSLQKIKGETGLAGGFLDEAALIRAEKRCNSLGIELTGIKDGVTGLRDPVQILKELASAYNSLPDGSARKAGILTDIGGENAGGVLSGILSNWSLYEKMLGDFRNAGGIAMKGAEQSAGSWESSWNRLSNSWTDLVDNIANSNVFVTLIHFANSFLEVINKITSHLKSLPSIGLGLGIFAGIKNVGKTPMKNHPPICP